MAQNIYYPLYSLSGESRFTRYSCELGEVIYQKKGTHCIVVGDPQAPSFEIKLRVWESFCDWAKDNKFIVCGYYFSEEFSKIISGFSRVPIGVSRLLDFDLKYISRLSARPYAVRVKSKANNLGWRVLEIEDLKEKKLLRELYQVWKKSKRGPWIGFVLNGFNSHAKGRWFLLNNQSGKTIGFLTLRNYGKGRWYLDQLIRDPKAPNLSMDYLVLKMIELLAGENGQELSLGFCPYINVTSNGVLPFLIRLYGKANLFYNSKGLYYFKKKYTNIEASRYLLLNQSESKFMQIIAFLRATYGL